MEPTCREWRCKGGVVPVRVRGQDGWVFSMSEETSRPRRARLIDDNLRLVYEQSLQQDIPDRFLELIARLKTKGPDHEQR